LLKTCFDYFWFLLHLSWKFPVHSTISENIGIEKVFGIVRDINNDISCEKEFIITCKVKHSTHVVNKVLHPSIDFAHFLFIHKDIGCQV
jgi:hypothetical protein